MNKQAVTQKIQKAKGKDYSLLETELGKKVYKQLLEDGIDKSDFWIGDIAMGMTSLLSQALQEVSTQAKEEMAKEISEKMGKWRGSGGAQSDGYSEALDDVDALLLSQLKDKEECKCERL